MSEFAGKHILIIIENLPAPFDRRVWQEASSLKKQGADVSIICPKMKGYSDSYEEIDGIAIYRHPLPVEGSGAIGYLMEYSTALFWELFLSFKIFFRKRFHVIHGCNPPDLIFLTALPFKLFGVKFVFDHHDINPELYLAKFGKKDFFYRCMLWFERLTFKTAHYSIATNESYRKIAIERGKMPSAKVQVVRSGPSLERIKIQPGNEKYKKGRSYLVGYVGVIGVQEGLDLLMESVKYLVGKRQDVQFAIVGGGTSLDEIKLLANEMGVGDYVDFYGRVSDEMLLDVLNSCDVCVNPDKPTEMNNLSTMNKIMEYMALRKPIVQYDLKEGRASAQQASLYAKNHDTADFAEKIMWLLDHEEESASMAEYGYERVINQLSWDHESSKLINFYAKVLSVTLKESASISV
jgi:glycosyltransferase involved in cell wall biosynthesis